MQLFSPLVPDPRAPLARANPVAKLAAGSVLLVALFASLDGVTAGIVLVALLALLPFSGLAARDLLSRAWLVGLAAISIGVFNVLFASEQLGPTVVALGPVRVGAETLVDGLGLALRLLGVVLAGLLATVTTQPTELADSLVQQLRVSPRFAIGALAALRLLPLLTQEWQSMAMARRARGVEAGRSADRSRAPVRRPDAGAPRRCRPPREPDGPGDGGTRVRRRAVPHRGPRAAYAHRRLGLDRWCGAPGGDRDRRERRARDLAPAFRMRPPVGRAYHRSVIHQEELRFRAGDASLAGTLTLPEAERPAAVGAPLGELAAAGP